jgi:ATP-binding cassette subfamily B protein
MFVGNLSYAVIAVLGGLQIVSGTMSLGSVQAFIQYSRQFNQPLSQVAGMATMLQSGVASAERVYELLDAEEQEPETADAISLDAASRITEGRVEFDHVRFSYSPDKELIRDLSLVADPGHTVAIVGPTGAGKTTLVNLVMRFYEIDGGRITIDDVDIRDLTREQLRSRTGMVLQDTWLFNGTILENIRYGRLDATDAEVVAAAKATHVDDFVRHLPEGYETVLDSDASNVSAGEKQLLTIARAFLARPSLLILDEATSSVDTRTEQLVQNAMNTLRTGRTSFVIAHRLSTIRDADLILVMEQGDIVEQGTHDELLAAQGAYARLYQSQFEGATQDLEEDEPEPELPSAPAEMGF